jgi:hypothetical protein
MNGTPEIMLCFPPNISLFVATSDILFEKGIHIHTQKRKQQDIVDLEVINKLSST